MIGKPSRGVDTCKRKTCMRAVARIARMNPLFFRLRGSNPAERVFQNRSIMPSWTRPPPLIKTTSETGFGQTGHHTPSDHKGRNTPFSGLRRGVHARDRAHVSTKTTHGTNTLVQGKAGKTCFPSMDIKGASAVLLFHSSEPPAGCTPRLLERMSQTQ